MTYKFLNSNIIITFIIFSGSFSIIGPLRLIEISALFFALIFILINNFRIPFAIISKLFLCLMLFISILTLFYHKNENYLFSLRFMSSLFVCVVFFYTVIYKKYFGIYSYFFFILALVLYKLSIYNYFWEYSYIFAIFLATHLYLKNYFLAFLDIILLFTIGQRVSTLNIFFIFYSNYFLKQKNYKKIFFLTVFFFVTFSIFQTLDTRSINAFKKFNFSGTKQAFFDHLDEAKYFDYDEFVITNKHDVLRYTKTNSQDFSLNIRFRKWSHAISNTNLYSFFFGLGPGYFGKAADSGWFRLLFCYGFIIFSLFVYLVYRINKISNKLQKMIIGIFVISNLFLDIMFAPLLMGFTGMMLGLAKNYNENIYR